MAVRFALGLAIKTRSNSVYGPREYITPYFTREFARLPITLTKLGGHTPESAKRIIDDHIYGCYKCANDNILLLWLNRFDKSIRDFHKGIIARDKVDFWLKHIPQMICTIHKPS